MGRRYTASHTPRPHCANGAWTRQLHIFGRGVWVEAPAARTESPFHLLDTSRLIYRQAQHGGRGPSADAHGCPPHQRRRTGAQSRRRRISAIHCPAASAIRPITVGEGPEGAVYTPTAEQQRHALRAARRACSAGSGRLCARRRAAARPRSPLASLMLSDRPGVSGRATRAARAASSAARIRRTRSSRAALAAACEFVSASSIGARCVHNTCGSLPRHIAAPAARHRRHLELRGARVGAHCAFAPLRLCAFPPRRGAGSRNVNDRSIIS